MEIRAWHVSCWSPISHWPIFNIFLATCIFFYVDHFFLLPCSKPIIKWDLLNVALLCLKKRIKSLGFVPMEGRQIIKYVKLLLNGEEGSWPPEKVLWTSFSRGIVSMEGIISKTLLSGCRYTDDVYRFITLNRIFYIMMTSLKVIKRNDPTSMLRSMIILKYSRQKEQWIGCFGLCFRVQFPLCQTLLLKIL